jgi:anaphase-promoting complex subunit 8
MAFIFSVYTRQQLFETTERLLRDVEQLERIFPNSAFLKTQRALLHYSNKGKGIPPSIVNSFDANL